MARSSPRPSVRERAPRRDEPVLAAGGVLWRGGPHGVEVAVVHRPRYDDWSLPKGKLEPGEHPLAAAVREVGEETGHRCAAGRTLGHSRYRVLQDGVERDKVVRWWALRALDDEPALPTDGEVDELRWLPPHRARELLTAGRDASVLELGAREGTGTTTVLLVRHGRAGDRRAWPGDDADRPLDERGAAQARALAALLPAYGPVRVLAAPLLRCVQTVAPLAQGCGLTVETDARVGDAAWQQDPAVVLDRVRELAVGPGAVVVAGQGAVVPGVVTTLCAELGATSDDLRAQKGSVWALTFLGGRLVDADHLTPLA